jgi:hypothetical protein
MEIDLLPWPETESEQLPVQVSAVADAIETFAVTSAPVRELKILKEILAFTGRSATFNEVGPVELIVTVE